MMDAESARILRKIIIDLICICCAGFPVLFFFLFGDPYKRGFFCDDESLRHPFHPSTVTNVMLYCVGLCLPICLMILIEYIHYRQEDHHVIRKFMNYSINSWIWRSYCVIGVFGFGAACNQFLTDVAKYTIGRLRPHFYEVCNPHLNPETKIDCSLSKYKNEYIEDFICMNSDQRLVRETRLSFVSGHSSFSAYTMIYLMLYLQARFTWKGSHLVKHLLQMICFLLAWVTALSRISDYKHHWSDVLAGSILGSIIAIVMVSVLFYSYLKFCLWLIDLHGFSDFEKFGKDEIN
uniref:Phosphatidic acid phosphatase type 2/haloperoxidase domain-containing protein n=1 Tax=Clastoptera arizonana TaxID=38151 RepID=A0A1B6CQX8_9HEMI